MKRFLMLSVLLLVMMIITPLISVRYERVKKITDEEQSDATCSETIKVMASDNGFIKSMDIREYLIGCVAGEMPVSYHSEALKAQTVASYTYVKYISNRDKEVLGGADVSDDSAVHQSYIDEVARKNKWGDDFDENEKLIASVVDEVLYQYLSYENKPAMAVYHNMSSGRTESSENVWGNKISYLVSVASAGDRLAPDYLSENKFEIDKFKSILQNNKIDFSEKVTVNSRFDSGLVKSVTIGENVISGSDLRQMFTLKSADFDVQIDKKNVVFTCRGNGHFVGMSQYGADYMARQGATYDEILNHYYPGTQLVKLKK